MIKIMIKIIKIPVTFFEVRNIMLYLCFVMFRFKCQTVLEAIAVKIKMYDPRDEAKSKGELPFVIMKT